MTVLVTGGNGCVGHALKRICQDWIFIERKDCDLTNKELTIEIFKKIQPEYVVHLAAHAFGFYNIDKVASFSNNVRINENVLEAANLIGVERGIFCLSAGMFTETPSKFPMDESMIFEGSLYGDLAGYAYSKRMLALQCQNYNEQHKRKYFGLIPCNIYGPDDNINSGRLVQNLIYKFNDAIKNDTDVVINGTGKPSRQLIYSVDLAKIIKYLVSNYDDTKPIICCDNTEISVANLANQIGNIMNFHNEIKFDTSKQDGNLKKTMDNSYLKKIMPHILFTPLQTGLKLITSDMRHA